jgi:serine/tyrosine/threonine adenylyltransferase
MPFSFDNSYARLPEAFYARVAPTPVAAPRLIALNLELAELLGLDAAALAPDEAAAVFSGNVVPAGAEPIAMAYSGHQFGGFSPLLGDGRAILLGEVIGSDGLRRDIHLKGAGQTPFSRRGDGRSALGPVLREYLVSEAMHALGVPTTRALAAVWTGEPVYRETQLPGGILTRVARSHIRVGTFEYFRARNDLENLRRLLDYAARRLDAQAAAAQNPALALLEGAIARQAELVAAWMSLGFIHGVMNTDNTSISGETLDFGPCAFLDRYEPAKTFSSIDHGGRYAFNNQPAIAQWNLGRLADCLLPLLAGDEKRAIAIAEAALDDFAGQIQAALNRRFSEKIGVSPGDDASWALVESLLRLMHRERADFTRTFHRLAGALAGDESPLPDEVGDGAALRDWLGEWRADLARRGIETAQAVRRMRSVNPVVIPRNHQIEAVIEAGNDGDFEPFHRLHAALREPYAERPENAEYQRAPRPDEEVQATFCGT